MVNYYVRVYCETEGEYKRTMQIEEIDSSWVPPGCEEHTIRDFCVEYEES